jgi:hypothetical protein
MHERGWCSSFKQEKIKERERENESHQYKLHKEKEMKVDTRHSRLIDLL